ncbi:MAG: hypothetical protein ACP6IQ_02265 [Candidatus Njordarchaeia archaeon]
MLVDAGQLQSFLKTYDIEIYHKGRTLPGNITEITITSDPTPGSLQFALPSPDTTYYYNNPRENPGEQNLNYQIPLIGDEIVVRVSEKASINIENKITVFKGFVRDVSHQKNESGSLYAITCVDNKAHLENEVIYKTYNEIFVVTARPTFDSTNNLYTPKKMTVKEIVEDIIETASHQILEDKNIIHFTKNDLDWSLVGKELTDFIPETLKFENVTILQAIYRTISSAGTYRIIYDAERDKIIFSKVSLNADKAGDKRIFFYAEADKNSPNKDYVNAYNNSGTIVDVVSDNSVRRTQDLANYYRMYGAKVEWYSGHYYIDEDHNDYNFTINNKVEYYLSNKNWDGYKYYFPETCLGSEEKRRYVIVGIPLYPQWNPLEGYEAYKEALTKNVILAPKGQEFDDSDHKWTKYLISDYENQEEVNGITVLDRQIPLTPEIGQNFSSDDINVALGFTYEAWFPYPGKCKHCDGTGAVENATVWGDNYEFGNTHNKSGLTPFNYAYNSKGIPTRHPLPWKNTCPACRGVGREPWFKITNILGALVDLPPDKIRVEDLAEQTMTNWTWNQMIKDLTYNFPPQVKIEYNYLTKDGVSFDGTSSGDLPKHPLAGLKSKVGDPITIIPEDEKIKQLFYTQIGPATDYVIDYIRGNVIFKSRHFIGCRKLMKTLYLFHGYNRDAARDEVATMMYKDYHGSGKHVTVYNEDYIPPYQYPTYWRPARAWITCYFYRERFYDTNIGGPLTFKTDVSGEGKQTYIAKPAIIDGRICYEVKEKHPEKDTEFDARIAIKGQIVNEYRLQVYPEDIGKNPVPKYSEEGWQDSKTSYIDNKAHNYAFPSASTHVMEALRDSEIKGTKYDGKNIHRSDRFPKKISWVHRDYRRKLLEHAVRELEKRNNIQITGNMVLRGQIFDLRKGMGYVEFDDGLRITKSCIVKITYSLKDDFLTTIELTTEEMRLGEENEEQQDYKRKMETKIDKMFIENVSTINALQRGDGLGRDSENKSDVRFRGMVGTPFG